MGDFIVNHNQNYVSTKTLYLKYLPHTHKYVYICVYTFVFIYVCVCVCIYVSMCEYIYMYNYIHIYVHMCVSIYMCVCTYILAYVCVYENDDNHFWSNVTIINASPAIIKQFNRCM